MTKLYSVADNTWEKVGEVMSMVNNNCRVDGEEEIPMTMKCEEGNWYIECLDEKDEPRLEKHLNYIYDLE